jgi:hypothetical protein
MKTEIRNLLARESEWQKRRSDLPWDEKLRQSLLLRDTARQLRQNRQDHPRSASADTGKA